MNHVIVVQDLYDCFIGKASHFSCAWRSSNLIKIQGDKGPEKVGTTEAAFSLSWETRLCRTDMFWPWAFLPSLTNDKPWVGELMLFEPHCWIPRESLPFKAVAVLKSPFKLMFERRRLLVLGLDPNKFSCSTTTWLCTFFFSCGGVATSSQIW